MKILIACEYSGIVRDAFLALGHEAMSCDLLPTERPGPHYQGDVFDVIDYPWDLMVAHPPCTHQAVSGARHFAEKRMDGRQQSGVSFFYEAGQVRHSPEGVGEPCLHYFKPVEKARSNHSALAIRSWGKEGNLLVA